MHWIARHILRELTFTDTLRYTELKPDAVEGNLFQYHARKLEKQGLIERSGDGYTLTPAGSQFVADLSRTKLMSRFPGPRVVIMVVAQNETGEQLLFRWRRHPYRGQVSFPFGRYFAGRSVLDMAAEHLRSKSGYEGDIAFMGDVHLITAEDHLLIQVFSATNLRAELSSDNLTGTSFWGDWGAVPAAERLPGMNEIVAWVQDPHRLPLVEVSV